MESADVLTAGITRTEAFQALLMALINDERAAAAAPGLKFEFFEFRRERAISAPPVLTGAAQLRERLRNDARVLSNGNVDVSAFVGSNVDVALLDDAAAELHRRLGPLVTDHVTKILTTGASGQQIALPLARFMSVPLVVCRREVEDASDKDLSAPLGRVAYADAVDVTYFRRADLPLMNRGDAAAAT